MRRHAYQLHGDRQRSARGITPDQTDAETVRQGHEPGGKRLEPLGVGDGHRQRQCCPLRVGPHCSDVAQIDRQRAVTDGLRLELHRKMDPGHERVDCDDYGAG